MESTLRPSPWWYRRRDAVFGLIYGAGFFAGGMYSGTVYHAYVPLYVQAAERFGASAGAAVTAVMFALMAACFALRVWGSSYLHARIVWSEDARTDSLVVAGPFRFTRNPLYFGNVLMAAGFGAFAPLSGWIVLNLLNVAFVLALIRWEEPGLRARYGAQFERYRANVPALFPRLVPAAASGSAQPSLAEGLKSEIFVGALFAGMIALFVLPPLAGWCTFGVLYVAGITAQQAVARSSGAEQ